MPHVLSTLSSRDTNAARLKATASENHRARILLTPAFAARRRAATARWRPALSRRERRNRRPSVRMRHLADEARILRIFANRPKLSPLPLGEGKGERNLDWQPAAARLLRGCPKNDLRLDRTTTQKLVASDTSVPPNGLRRAANRNQTAFGYRCGQEFPMSPGFNKNSTLR